MRHTFLWMQGPGCKIHRYIILITKHLLFYIFDIYTACFIQWMNSKNYLNSGHGRLVDLPVITLKKAPNDNFLAACDMAVAYNTFWKSVRRVLARCGQWCQLCNTMSFRSYGSAAHQGTKCPGRIIPGRARGTVQCGMPVRDSFSTRVSRGLVRPRHPF